MNISTLGCGLAMGYSAVILPHLKDPYMPLYLDENEGAWFGKFNK